MQLKSTIIDDQLWEYTLEKGKEPYLSIIQIPEQVYEQASSLEKYINSFEGVSGHKLFVKMLKTAIPRQTREKFIGQIQQELKIQNDKIIDLENTKTIYVNELIQALLERQHGKNLSIQYYFQKKGDKIVCVVDSSISALEYAFYVVEDGQKKFIKWYDTQNYIEFPQNEDEKLDVVSFIQTSFGKIIHRFEYEDIRYSNAMDDIDKYYIESDKKKVYIHGSCVTRDILNFGDTQKICLSGYVARHSIFSVNQIHFEEINDCEIDLKSNFQKRMLLNDCKKIFQKEIHKIDAKYILVDFIDTVRFPIYQLKGSVITGSTEAIESGILQQYPFEKVSIFNMTDEEIKEKMKEYFTFLKTKFKEENIVIHCAYFKYVYKNEYGKIRLFSYNDITKSRFHNKMLKRYHTIARELLPNAVFIDFCKDKRYLSDAKHHFGLSPVHYEEKYYLKVLDIIKNLD